MPGRRRVCMRKETILSKDSLEDVIAAAVAATPGSAEWELELCRREYNDAGRVVREAQAKLDSAVQELVSAAQRYGRADEAARHGGYGPEPI